MKSNAFELHNYAAILTPSQHGSTTSLKMKTAPSTSATRRSEKYSLRQRQKRRNARTQQEEQQQQPQPTMDFSSEAEFSDTTRTKTTLSGAATCGPKASGHGAVTRKAKPAVAAKSKTKAAPLSKYRRKTANARERTRMREINSAFENLRHCVPHPISGDDPSNTNEKLTKITTLRLAMRYIGLLSDALTNPGLEPEFILECLRNSSERQLNSQITATLPMDSDFAQSSLPGKTKQKTMQTPPAKTSKATAKAKPAKRSTAAPTSSSKRQTKKQKMQAAQHVVVAHAFSSPESAYSSSGVASPACSSSSSAYASLSAHSTLDIATAGYSRSSLSLSSTSSSSAASPLYNATASAVATNLLDTSALELNALLLESDGESLHLSEHCLSPLQSGLAVGRHADARGYASDLLSAALPQQLGVSTDLPINCPVLEQPDVELSLRLLDSNVHAFDFAGEPQQPSDCISPLATLDSFNPFGDLLHTDALDLFLT